MAPEKTLPASTKVSIFGNLPAPSTEGDVVAFLKKIAQPVLDELPLPKTMEEAAALMKKMSSPVPELNAKWRDAYYEKFVPEEYKTALTKEMEKATKYWSLFEKLQPSDFADPKKAALIDKLAGKWATSAVVVFDQFYTNNGLHYMYAVWRLIKESQGHRDAIAIKVDLGITQTNAIDTNGGLSDVYLDDVGDWFSDEIRYDKLYDVPNKWKPTVVQLPGTSLLIVGTNKKEGEALVELLKKKLPKYNAYFVKKLQNAQAEGLIDPDVVIDSNLKLKVDIHYSTIKLAHLKDKPAKEVLDHGIKSLIKLSEEAFAIGSEGLTPTWQTGLVKMFGPDSIIDQSGNLLKSVSDMYGTQAGWIPLGVNNCDKYPDISAQRRDLMNTSGVVTKKALEFKKNPALAEDPKQWALFQSYVGKLGAKISDFAALARRNVGNPAFMKKGERVGDLNANYNYEELAKKYYLFEATDLPVNKEGLGIVWAEFDYANAFNKAYLPDEKDSKMNTLKMKIPAVIDAGKSIYNTPFFKGDEGVDMFSLATNGAGVADPSALGMKGQAEIKGAFSDLMFQPTSKHKYPNGLIKREPLWYKPGTEEFVISPYQPEGTEPFKTNIGATVVVARIKELPDPKTLKRMFQNGFKRIDGLKVESYHKGGFADLTEEELLGNGNGKSLKMSVLTDEELKGLGKIPGFESPPIKLGDLTIITPMPEQENIWDHILVTTPSSAPTHPDWVWGGEGWIIRPAPVEEAKPTTMITPMEQPLKPATISYDSQASFKVVEGVEKIAAGVMIESVAVSAAAVSIESNVASSVGMSFKPAFSGSAAMLGGVMILVDAFVMSTQGKTFGEMAYSLEVLSEQMKGGTCIDAECKQMMY